MKGNKKIATTTGIEIPEGSPSLRMTNKLTYSNTLAWNRGTSNIEMRKAMKALKVAKKLEKERLASGEYHYVDGYKGMRLEKKPVIKKKRKK